MAPYDIMPMILKWNESMFMLWDVRWLDMVSLEMAVPLSSNGLSYRHFLAIALESEPQRGYMDIEWVVAKRVTEGDVLDALKRVNDIANHFLNCFCVEYFPSHTIITGADTECSGRYYVSNGSRYKDSDSFVYKFSFHVVYGCSSGCCFINFEHLKSYYSFFVQWINARRNVPDFYYHDGKSVVDLAVYTRHRAMRLIGSCKSDMRPFRIVDSQYLPDIYWTHNQLCDHVHAHYTAGCFVLPALNESMLGTNSITTVVTNTRHRVAAAAPIPAVTHVELDPVVRFVTNVLSQLYKTTCVVKCFPNDVNPNLYRFSVISNPVGYMQKLFNDVILSGRPNAFMESGQYDRWFRVCRMIAVFCYNDRVSGLEIWERFSTWAPKRGESIRSQWDRALRYVERNGVVLDLDIFNESLFLVRTAGVVPEIAEKYVSDFVTGVNSSEYQYAKGTVTVEGDDLILNDTRSNRTLYIGNLKRPYKHYIDIRYLTMDAGLLNRIRNWIQNEHAQQTHLFLHSNMDTGKSTLIQQIGSWLKPKHSVLFITNRQALAYDLYGRFGGHIRGLQHYRTFSREDPLRLIVQLNSLCKHTNPHDIIDLVIFEESESLLNYVSASTLDSNRLEVFLRLQVLMGNARRILVLDADVDERTYEFLRKVSAPQYETISYFNVCTSTRRTHLLYSSEEEFVFQMLSTFYAKKKFAVVTNSVTKAEMYHKLLISSVGSGEMDEEIRREIEHENEERILLYTGNSPLPLKKSVGECNTIWVRKDVIIYTSVIGSGVNFDPPGIVHFDRIFVHAVARSCCARELHQQAHRIRKLNETDVHVYIPPNPVAENAPEQHIIKSLDEFVHCYTLHISGEAQKYLMPLLNLMNSGVRVVARRVAETNIDDGRVVVRQIIDMSDPLTFVLMSNLWERYLSLVDFVAEYKRYCDYHGDKMVNCRLECEGLAAVRILIDEFTEKTVQDYVENVATSAPDFNVENPEDDGVTAETHVLTKIMTYFSIPVLTNRLILTQILNRRQVDIFMREFCLFMLGAMSRENRDRYIQMLCTDSMQTEDRALGDEMTYHCYMTDGIFPRVEFFRTHLHSADHKVSSFTNRYPVDQIADALACVGIEIGTTPLKNIKRVFTLPRRNQLQKPGLCIFLKKIVAILPFLGIGKPKKPTHEWTTFDPNADGIELSEEEKKWGIYMITLKKEVFSFFGFTKFNALEERRVVYHKLAHHLFGDFTDEIFTFPCPDIDFNEK